MYQVLDYYSKQQRTQPTTSLDCTTGAALQPDSEFSGELKLILCNDKGDSPG